MDKETDFLISNKPTRAVIALFWALFAFFILIIASMQATPLFLIFRYAGFIMPIIVVIFFLVSIAFLVLAIRQKLEKLFKRFLILTGASAVGIPVSILLHGAVFALFIKLFGENFWERTGIGDEPFFFILAVIVCPIAFLVGAIGSIVLFVKRRRT